MIPPKIVFYLFAATLGIQVFTSLNRAAKTFPSTTVSAACVRPGFFLLLTWSIRFQVSVYLVGINLTVISEESFTINERQSAVNVIIFESVTFERATEHRINHAI